MATHAYKIGPEVHPPAGEQTTPPAGDTGSQEEVPPAGHPGLASTTAESPSTHPEPPAVLRRFGKYELLHEIARGGMGVVYKARDTALNRTVALKTIQSGVLAGPEEVERFLREAQAVAHLNHPHIIRIYEIGEQDGQHYFTMEFAGGGGLDKNQYRLADDARAVAALGEKIARAVHYAHTRGILHRDLKPANVLLNDHDEPVVSDFGLAKFLDSKVELTVPGQMLGTPAYMAPEQAAGHLGAVNPTTDVWALGVLLYEMLVGRRPFTGATRHEVLQQIQTTDPLPPRAVRPGLDPGLEAIVLRCLKRDQGRRYASAGLLADDLGRWLRGETIQQLPPSWSRRLGKQLKKRSGSIMAVLGVVCAALAFLAVNLLPSDTQAPAVPDQPAGAVQLGQTLIDDEGPWQQARWLVGRDQVAVVPGQGAYTLAAQDTALLELVDRPRWPYYRFETELRLYEVAFPTLGAGMVGAVTVPPAVWSSLACALVQGRKKPGDGHAGFYFAHMPHPDKGFAHCFLRVGFSHRPYLPATVSGKICRMHFPEDGLSTDAGFLPHEDFPFTFPWVRLAVEVDRDEVRFYRDDQRIGAMERAKLEVMPPFSGRLLQGSGLSLQGGLGIYLVEARASFRRASIRPLPQE